MHRYSVARKRELLRYIVIPHVTKGTACITETMRVMEGAGGHLPATPTTAAIPAIAAAAEARGLVAATSAPPFWRCSPSAKCTATR